MFENIEEKIKKFRLGRDYSFYDDGQRRVYFLISLPIKEAVCPFPKILGINGVRKSERNESGNYFSYEEGENGSPDKFTVKSSEVSPQKTQKSEEIKKLDEQAKKWDRQMTIWDNEAARWDEENARIAQNPHPRTVSFSVYNDKEEKVFEKTKTSTYYPPSFGELGGAATSLQIKEISEEEAKMIEDEQNNKQKSELETHQHQLPKK